MQFSELAVKGAYLIEMEKKEDERGFFSRAFCQELFLEKGLQDRFVQVNNSMSHEKGTLRGLHYQESPKAEVKIVRCISGALFDVILDLRVGSPTFGKWQGEILSSENRKMFYVPEGCAHGFLTLTERAEVIYLVSEFYSSQHERGIRFDDPYFNIQWPMKPKIISQRDQNHPFYR